MLTFKLHFLMKSMRSQPSKLHPQWFLLLLLLLH
jgi:hypothetical protein